MNRLMKGLDIGMVEISLPITNKVDVCDRVELWDVNEVAHQTATVTPGDFVIINGKKYLIRGFENNLLLARLFG
jgi:hypothetical protein